MLDGVAHREDPDEGLQEAERAGDAALAADREEHAERVAGHVHDAAEEDEQRAHRRGEERIEVRHGTTCGSGGERMEGGTASGAGVAPGARPNRDAHRSGSGHARINSEPD
jgi:hypothetical protein